MLISNIETLKNNIGAIDKNFNWQSISSYVEDAERDIIGEAIGDDTLEYFTENLIGLTGYPAKVLVLLIRAEAYLSVLKWSQFALFRMTDRALYIAKSTDGAIISDKKLRDLRNQCEEQGFNFLDRAIGLMEDNLSLFPVFAESPARTNILKCFIKTAGDFNYQRSIEQSRLTYMSLTAIMQDIQDEYLPDIMGADFYQSFKTRFATDELTSDEQKLLPLMKKGIAFLTIAKACNVLPIKVGSKGLLINRYNDTREYDQADPADAGRIQFLSDDNQDKGERKLNDLKNYLIKNASLYEQYLVTTADNTSVNNCHSGIVLF